MDRVGHKRPINCQKDARLPLVRIESYSDSCKLSAYEVLTGRRRLPGRAMYEANHGHENPRGDVWRSRRASR